MAESTLNTLPDEILLHHLLKYLSCYDVFTLRQVNRHFYKVFMEKQTWERFLHYPLKYYLCDRKSESTVARVREVLEEISQQEHNRSSRLLSYCRLQEAHLLNWVERESPILQCRRINVSIRDVAYMAEMVDDNNEHWVCLSVRDTLRFWNITADPESYGVVDVGPHSLREGVGLLPCGKVLVKDQEGCIMTVYELSPEENTVQLRYFFKFDEDEPVNDVHLVRNVGNSFLHSFYFRFILMSPFFIGYMSLHTTPRDRFLHVWNLDADRKWYITGLSYITKVFELYLQNNGVNMEQRYHLNLFEGESPYIVVVLKHTSNSITFSQLNIFDIYLGQFTHLIAQIRSDILSCSMFRNKIVVDQIIASQGGSCSAISVYSVPGQRAQDREELLAAANCREHHKEFDRLYSVVLKKYKSFIRTNNEVVAIFNSTFHMLEFPMEAGYKILGFIEPKLLLMYDSCRNPTDTEVRVYNILKKRLIRSWDHVNTDSSRFKHYFSNLMYPSKLILNVESQEQFTIFYF